MKPTIHQTIISGHHNTYYIEYPDNIDIYIFSNPTKAEIAIYRKNKGPWDINGRLHKLNHNSPNT
jgi:hypothetical protein